ERLRPRNIAAATDRFDKQFSMPGDEVYGLALISAAIGLAFIYFLAARPSRPSSTPRPSSFDRWIWRGNAPPSYSQDAAPQRTAVMAASFEKRRLLNRSEYEAFKVIEADIAAARRGYRVFAQTTLGEVLKSLDDNAFHSINAKRVDMLIVDERGWPVAAV